MYRRIFPESLQSRSIHGLQAFIEEDCSASWVLPYVANGIEGLHISPLFFGGQAKLMYVCIGAVGCGYRTWKWHCLGL